MVQYWHKNQEGIVMQRELGQDTASFPSAIRQALNQDPDILAVGGIPDPETLELLLQAASSGMLVVALMDASSCVRAFAIFSSSVAPVTGVGLPGVSITENLGRVRGYRYSYARFA